MLFPYFRNLSPGNSEGVDGGTLTRRSGAKSSASNHADRNNDHHGKIFRLSHVQSVQKGI